MTNASALSEKKPLLSILSYIDFCDCPQRKASWTFIVQKWSFQTISIIKFVFLSNIFEQKNDLEYSSESVSQVYTKVRPKYSFHESISYEQKKPCKWSINMNVSYFQMIDYLYVSCIKYAFNFTTSCSMNCLKTLLWNRRQ